MNQAATTHGAATHVGHVRTVNQDGMVTRPPVFAVADGMGGHDGGEVASRLVMEELATLADGQDAVPPGTPGSRGCRTAREGARAVNDCLASAQQRIVSYVTGQRQQGHPRFHAGTTAVCALVVDDGDGPHWLIANIGDSRAYRWHEDRLEQVSVDHSVVQELVDAGRITPQQARHHPERHVVTRALGGGPVEADFYLLPLQTSPRLLLCSDGVSGMMEHEEIARVVALADDPGHVADRLVAAALDAGGEDNATAVVVDAATGAGRETR